ncbi:MCE family protein [Speluncibacter jeojiensis]|uniref:MCE family protein n=1 Tax=Speluncibacter jeojiensis TaxID=2710754 RepID=A0A9X4RHI4_9ACTN|nr:MCE family protein [Rhodococcus sp. D2-41]MDG3015126.1 MCE family protein [Corynebacteriales bacterium D3-21]
MKSAFAKGRRIALCAAAVASTLAISACNWNGLNSLPMPGTQGTGDGSFTVTAVMPSVGTLTQNSPVKIHDVTVGSIRDITLDKNWHAVVKVSLNPGTQLPGNATAMVGQASLLGSQYLELAPPVGIAPQGTLKGGDLIPLNRSTAAPTTEQTLSSLSVVLNGGGIAQIHDITTELNAALDGNQGSIRDLLPQLNNIVGSLDRQRGQIVAAMDGLNRLGGTVAQQNNVLDKALTDLAPATDVLAQQKKNLSDALDSLGNFSGLANQVLTQSRSDLEANIKNLGPILDSLANAGNGLVNSLSVIFTFPFPMHVLFNALKGDYTNLYETADLTVNRIQKSMFMGTPLAANLGGMDGIMGAFGGASGQKGNPFEPNDPTAAKPGQQDNYGPPATGAGK